MENKYKYIKINNLYPYTSNARTHSDSQIEKIANSINEFGFNNPVLIDKENGIIAGHGRVLAAIKLNMLEVPTLRIDHLSETQKRAYVLADNKLALDAGWDNDLLSLELERLQELDFNLDLTGFNDEELIALTGDIESIEFPELNAGDKNPYQQKTFTLHDTQANIVDDAIIKAKTYPCYNEGVNENSNGNALNYICEQWLKLYDK